jgi:two-component system, chemotaxis family, protein-glutamate methylesterase/glutaminase
VAVSPRIRVLVIDDSLLFRELLSRGLSVDPVIEVVATASDPYDARDKIVQYKPDVVTCDIEMPRMDGIQFIRRLLPQYPLPIIVVSSISEAVLDAMSAGAVDFVTKPDMGSIGNVEHFVEELIRKVKTAARSKVIAGENHLSSHTGSQEAAAASPSQIDVIAIGASTGGTEAIFKIVRSLPISMPGIVIVQHIPPIFSRMFAERLHLQTRLNVKEAQTGDYIRQGHVYVAPGNKHMRIKRFGKEYRIECIEGEKINGHCPSADILFESVAKEAGAKAIGVILTGMGYDGAKGLLTMRRKGARTIGQDAHSSVVYGMPKAAFEVGAVERQIDLHRIAELLVSLSGR